MFASNERFGVGIEAAAWDANPDVHRASDCALQAILSAHPALVESRDRGTTADDGIDVLDMGCGTGLLALRLAPYVRSIVAVDAAAGMVDALREKLLHSTDEKARGTIIPLCLLLEDPEALSLPASRDAHGVLQGGPRRKFDLVTSLLALHLVPDLAALLRTMYGCLKPGGMVALTDYEDFGPDSRRFHPEAKMAGVEHHGIDAKLFLGLMDDAGFENISVRTAWMMEKEVERFPGEWGPKKPEGEDVVLETMEFPFLLCRGTRKP